MTKSGLAEPGLEEPPAITGPRQPAPAAEAAPAAGDEVFVYPAAFAQERLWFLDQLEPGSPLYNMPLALLLRGRLDPAALGSALAAIARRHETLRTVFAVAGGSPVQVITPAEAAAPPPLPRIDLAALPPPARQREGERLAAAEAARPFDLAAGPLWRAVLLRLGAADHLLLVTLHHIVADGWSLVVLGKELGAFYAFHAFHAARRTGGAAGLPPPLPPPLPLQYADFAMWQREWLAGEEVAAELGYWRQRLAGMPPQAAVPLGRPRQHAGNHRSRRGATRAQALPAAGRDAFYALAQRASATRFMALLAAFAALLHRYTGEVDLVVGTPVAGRGEAATEELIGLFVNLLPLRLDLAGDPSPRQLLGRVRDACLGAFDHQEVPFEWLVRELHPERSLSHDPLVQVIFGLDQGLSVRAMDLPGLRLEPHEGYPRGLSGPSGPGAPGDGKLAKFDLGLLIEETAAGLVARLDFRLDLLEPCDAVRLAESLGVLLASAAAAPDRPLADLPLLPAAALHQALREWNDTAGGYPRTSTIAELFAAQAHLAPGAVALAAGEESVTYGELEARANRLAHLLRGLGVGPEVPVGLALNRSTQAVVAILGILKAGGAYVPLDPAYPMERLAFMMADAAAPVVVTEARHAAALAEAAARGGRLVRIVELDTAAAALAVQSDAAPALPNGAGADGLAYIMYTSGSTGLPKGVAVCQRAVVRLVRGNHFAELGAASCGVGGPAAGLGAPGGAGETLLQFAPIAFDASTFELWGSLLNGGRLVIFPDYAPSLRELGEAVTRQQVTTLWLTAGLFHQMVEGELGSLRGVRQLLAGGDVLMVPQVERALAALPELTLINGYGPTENVTFTCCRRLRGARRLGASVPIGRPIANTRVHLLDRQLRPVPAGVAGELCAGGDGLARGYFNRPDLTAERFVPDPLAGEPGARLYRTGDLARHLPDGDLEFLGRLDKQVKIRGFRVEPGEIEHHLLAHPAVRQAAVVVHEPAPGDRRLAAFFVPRPDVAAAAAAAELPGWLRERLPAPMRPSAYVPLPALPLDPNGKIDRRALAARLDAGGCGAPGWGADAGEAVVAWRQSQPGQPSHASRPSQPVEELLGEIWCDLLRLPAVAAHESFFDLGGHSLLATRVVSRVREVFGVEVPLRALFEAPTLGELAARVAAAGKPAGGAAAAGAGETAPPMARLPRDLPLPASFAQERLWFLDQLEGGGAAGGSYNVPLALELAGHLEPRALAAAWRAVARRHEALRTCFADAHPEIAPVVQVIAAAAAAPLPAVDLRHLAAAGGRVRREARRLALAAALRPFDLRRPPLLRALLLRLPAPARGEAPDARGDAADARPDGAAGPAAASAAGEAAEPLHWLVVCLHHIVCDGWSLGILLRELAALYGAALAGRPAPLAPLAVQYADFAVWQRAWLAGEVLAEQLAYWRRRLAGAPALLALPTDRPRPAVQSFRGVQRIQTLAAPLAGRLRELGRRQGTTLFMTLLAAWGAQLARLTGGEDVPVGSPIANRNRLEIEPLIGFFANTLVLRLDLAGDPTCGELLGRVRELTLDAYGHQDLPFEKLVEELRPERALSHSPLFQAMFVLQRQEELALDLPGIAAAPLRLAAETAKFDLGLAAAAGREISLSLEVNRDLFDAATATRLLSGLAALLEELAAGGAAGRRAGELSLLGAGERHQVLVEWNDTGAGPGGAQPVDLALHQLVELQARRTPEAVAVLDGPAPIHLTYGELERRADRLAHRLAGLGVGPEVRVGIAMERTAEMVVGLLAILKAGGAYVPLDPGYPRERLAFILADAQQGIAEPVLLTTESLRARLPEVRGRVLCVAPDGHPELDGRGEPDGGRELDGNPGLIGGPGQDGQLDMGGRGDGPPSRPVPPGGLAYVIYTSGSTGRPKGVAITHRSAVALLRWAGELFSPAQLAGVLASTSITFDLSVFELFLPLSRGGTVIVAGNALALPTLPARDAVTLINTVPSAMAELLRLGGVPAAAATVNLAGEPLKRALTDRIHGELGGVRRVHNLYGPSEDTTYSTWVRVAAGAGSEPTIGRPVAGTRAHVLDRRLQPLPVGVPGELCLGGAGLARGYLARPELTARSFVPDPCGGFGERLYRTGDLVRQLPDGELDFLGRLDHQVKLRGFRIELGEIEAALLAHPQVREAVVVAREDTPGRRRLVAYAAISGISGGAAAAAGGERPTAAALTAHLRQRLPDHMVPEACVLLDALPLTANGKVDRRALPAPERRRAGDAPAFTAPRDPVEELVAGIWSEVLGVEPIGIDDRFFDLGGHSLLATQVISRVRHACGVEMPLRSLFEAPALADFAVRVAAAIRRAPAAGEGRAAPPIERAVRRRPPPLKLPASFGQERLWFLDRLGAGGAAYNLPSVLRLRGEPAVPAVPALAAALAELVRRHESLRTTFAAAGDEVMQVIAPAGPVPLPVVGLAALPAGARAAARRRLAAACARRPFDLERGPLLRATLLRLAAGEHILVLVLHHIVSDGWSQGVLLGELAALYSAFAAGNQPALPGLPIQYADFAAWQRGWLRGETLEAQLAFWRRQLAGAPALLEMPLDRPRPAVQSFRGAQRAAELPPALSGELRALGRRQGATLFMTLLAAFSTLLGRCAGSEDVLVGTPIANRNRVETEGLIGFFVNTLVLRIGLAGDPTGSELLARVREATLAAYAHQDVPFEKLVEELRPRRNLSHAPIFQVVLMLQSQRPAAGGAPPAGSPPVAGASAPTVAAAPAAGLEPAGEELDHGTAKFDLNLVFAEEAGAAGGGRLRAVLEYCRDLFFAATAERLLGQFAALAAGLAAEPGRRLSELPLLTAAERQELVVEWNDSAAGSAAEQCLHEPFAAQAARAPSAPALVFGGESWSYGELDRFSNRLARQLVRTGVGPGKLVGILLERRCEMVGAVLAVHKAGGAYVPIEVRWPPDRLHWILASSGIACLVTEAAQLPLLAELPVLPALAHVVAVDEVAGAPDRTQAPATAGAGTSAAGASAAVPAPWTLGSAADFAALPATPLPRRAGPDDLAYIIFTSGSTGRPKGVMVRHRPALNLIQWVNETFEIGPADRLLFLTALSFDLSVYDVFGILAAGGSLRIARSEEVRDPETLVRILRTEPITFWDSAPAALQQLVPYLPAARPAPAAPAAAADPELPGRQEQPGALRLVFLSGDWIPVTLPDRLREAFPRARVIGLGGATEATVWSNWFPIAAVDPAWTSIPYGRPIRNARYFVLDGAGNPCPIGVPGDLYIAGDCLSAGYFGAPELTARSYRPDALSGGVGERLYATGDRARFGADGNIEFLGRVDSQVKVRGFRIELGEIESVLAAHEAVREAVVLVREDTPGDRRLVAYVIPAGEAPPARELRRFAQRKLPEYMLPSAFVLRDRWPVSANGKLDRKALPPPEAAPGGGSGAAEPAGAVGGGAPAGAAATAGAAGAWAADAAGGWTAGAAAVAGARAAAAGAGAATAAAEALVPPRTAMERAIAAVWREVIGLADVGVHDNFFEVGGHSLLMARVQARLEEALGRSVPLIDLFQHPTIAALATHLSGAGLAADMAGAAAAPDGPSEPAGRPAAAGSAAVAVIGLAGRFPGAGDAAEFWRNLRDGVESIRFFSDAELLAAGFPAALLGDPRLVRARGMLAGADQFDAAFFGYSPREAQVIDPQQRLFLECAWEALEDAGHDAGRGGARIGVFGGATENTYVLHLLTDPAVLAAVGRHQIAIANNPDFLCARVSYKLNLTGPSAAVQSACSTSLVAVHMACTALLRGDCDLALAGGVSVQAREVSGYLYEEGGISSPDGHTRAFDEAARGVVGGSGAGVVVLRRLDAALAAGDTVRAVILGSAVNNDGNLKVGFTAPSVEGQAAVIREALAAAGVEPSTIGYVEAHGTGTELGDPVEIAGLARAFGATEEAGRCALGSVKTNIGHLDAAAGVAGLIKTVLALEHRLIPPSLHFTRPSPKIRFAGTPFHVNARLAEWPADGQPRRAGVSSFGMGGTNAHVVMEEAPPAAPAAPSRPAQLLVVSARTPEALEQASRRLAEHLERRPDLELADVARTLQVGRRAFRCRRIVVCTSHGEAAAALRGSRSASPSLSLSPAASGTAPDAGTVGPVVFLFPGQGTQYPGMAAELYAGEPDFRAALDECSDLLAPHLGCDLRDLLYPREGGWQESGRDPKGAAGLDEAGGGTARAVAGRLGRARSGTAREAAARLERTEIAQPALFAVEYALARLYMAWGIRPQAMLGHSVGELVAACLAGVFTLPAALGLVAARGRLMQQLPAGAMLAVELPEAAVVPLLGDGAGLLDLAAVNSPHSCVVSGATAAVAALRRRLEEQGVSCRRLHTSHAFHSAMMDPILAAFGEQVAAVERQPPRLAWLSNVTGGWITPAEAVAPAYWARHLRQTVRFADALGALRGPAEGGGSGESSEGGEGEERARGGRRRSQEPILLEVGPGRTLTTLARQQAGEGWGRTAIASLPRAGDGGSDLAAALGALGRLWLAGVEVDWDGFGAHERRRRVPLPTYPFERRRFWLDGLARPRTAIADDAATTASGWQAVAAAGAEPAAAAGTASENKMVSEPAAAGFVAPRNEVEQGIAEIWRELLGVERVGVDDDFFALGGSSLMAVQFGARLRRRFGVEGASLLLEAPTLGELAAMVAAQAGAAATGTAAEGVAAEGATAAAAAAPPSCLVRLQAGGARRPLFLVHQVGGNVFSFRALARGLGRELPVYGLRSRGLEAGEQPLASVEEMAELYLGLLRGVQPRGPYRIGGASMGGMVAWEMAQRLQGDGEAVELLALMDTPCGEQMPARPAADWEFVGAVLAGRIQLTPAELMPLPLDAQLEYALDKGRRAGAGDDLTVESARRLVAVLKANVGALFGYAPRPYPGRLLYFRARERRAVDPPRPELPWIELAAAGTEVVLVPGDHETMHAPPQVSAMVERLAALL